MKHIVSVVLLGAATMLAASALAQTATKPPAKPAPATKTAAAAPRPVARPVGVHPTIIPRRPVFVPPPPVIELDEIAVVPDLPTVLDTDTRETYRRIFQAQASGQFAQADADIARLKDKTLMGYVGAQRLLSPGHPATFDQLAAWLQEYNDHPDAPAIYKLALSRRTAGGPELTPASFDTPLTSIGLVGCCSSTGDRNGRPYTWRVEVCTTRAPGLVRRRVSRNAE